MVDKTSILLEALPYIQKFYGKILVIKFGGSLLEEIELRDSILRDLVLLKFIGIKPVVIHGGGSEISKEMEKIGKKPEFVEGLRVTDEETIDIIHKSLGGKINKELVLVIQKHGGSAIGISGIDGNLVLAERMSGERKELGYVGEVSKINPKIINYLLDEDFIPVIASIGADENGTSLNLNADHVAAELASAMKAEKLIFLTDVPGVLEDPEREDSLISTLNMGEAKELVESETITEGMIPKVNSCLSSLKSGVNRTHIINGKTPHALLLELLTESGIGTMIGE
ncbi:MAG: acetylglutamate kinase [Candidatus Hadarchaeia archaeon]